MKIHLLSDVHLEFAQYTSAFPDADVLVIAGDLVPAEWLHERYTDANARNIKKRTKKFFTEACEKYKDIFWIFGNHEFYNGNVFTAMDIAKEFMTPWTQVQFLQNSKVTLDGVTFLGATMWTDFNNEDPLTLYQIGMMMNDFRLIRRGDHIYDPHSALEYHKKSRLWLEGELAALRPTDKAVVITHMAPSRQSLHPRYKEDYIMNGGYSSNLEYMMWDNANIKLWFHGHTHDSFDYKIDQCRILANPRGYAYPNSPGQENSFFDPNFIVEV